VLATISSSLTTGVALRTLSTEKRDEYHRLWKTLSSRRTAVFPASLRERVAALCYVKNAHSARKRLPRPIGIDGRERRAEREIEGKELQKGGGGIGYSREKDRGGETTVAIRGLELAGGLRG